MSSWQEYVNVARQVSLTLHKKGRDLTLNERPAFKYENFPGGLHFQFVRETPFGYFDTAKLHYELLPPNGRNDIWHLEVHFEKDLPNRDEIVKRASDYIQKNSSRICEARNYGFRRKTDYEFILNNENVDQIAEAIISFDQEFYDDILNIIAPVKSMSMKNKYDLYTKLLTENHNIILHGAPGTGKTYLAKKIAEEMDAEYEMVQFHQSYDYTDFVEGLRPAKSGDDNENVSFERVDGSFKEFCKKALGIENQHYQGFDSAYKELLNDIKTKKLKFTTLVRSKTFGVEINTNNNLYAIPDTESATKMPITKENLQAYVETGKIKDWKPYVTSIGEYLRNTYSEKLGQLEKDKPTEKKKYVFHIDEINRGEISKIFGELFFSIDPDYRGKKGRINTQYQNLVEKDDAFTEGFFVPENVYIIGTMNDIDRSVESMDFAMRRRFAFKEIKASDRIEMLDDLKCGKKEESVARMTSINNAIEKVPGLSSAYHIGPAYFLKLDNYEGDFDLLWEYHIEGVVKEYLRGIDPDGAHFEVLKKAYEGKTQTENLTENAEV